MNSNEVGICSKALALVGTRSTIASLTESSNEAIACNMIYADTRDEIMTSCDWNFARKTAVLAMLKAAPGTPVNPQGALLWTPAYPAPPWLYSYAYPTDCLAMQQIVPQTSFAGSLTSGNQGGIMSTGIYGGANRTARWLVATDTDNLGNSINVILTNEYQALAIYTAQITNPNLFGSNFVQALIATLAAKLAISLTGNLQMSQLFYGRAKEAMREAMVSDANEGLTVLDPTVDWLDARDNSPSNTYYGG